MDQLESSPGWNIVIDGNIDSQWLVESSNKA